MLNTLNVIKLNPHILQISSELHSIDQVYPGSGPYLKHLKNNHLVGIRALARKLVLLNVGLVATASARCDAVYDSKSLKILERGDIVLDAWGAHIFALIKNRD